MSRYACVHYGDAEQMWLLGCYSKLSTSEKTVLLTVAGLLIR